MNARRTDIWSPFGIRLLGFETSDEVNGEVKFTGLLSPIAAALKLPIAMYLQSQLYSKYDLSPMMSRSHIRSRDYPGWITEPDEYQR